MCGFNGLRCVELQRYGIVTCCASEEAQRRGLQELCWSNCVKTSFNHAPAG